MSQTDVNLIWYCMFRVAATPHRYHPCLFSCLVSRTLPTVCAADGGTKGRCLQDFELMESRQGLGMDTWQVISCKSSVGGRKERHVIFYTLKKGHILHLAWMQCNIISQLCFFFSCSAVLSTPRASRDKVPALRLNLGPGVSKTWIRAMACCHIISQPREIRTVPGHPPTLRCYSVYPITTTQHSL